MSGLRFSVSSAHAKPRAASPAIAFGLHVASNERIEALVLRVQIRIEPGSRTYGGAEKTLLRDLFGTPDRWHSTLHALSWADVPVVVPAFDDEAHAEIAVPCTYDFDISAARFLNAVEDGEIPLRFLFSGAIFREASSSFSSERVSWSSECSYRMPAAVWKQAMRECYGDDALIRVKRETLEQLQAVRALSGAASWDDLFERLAGART
jgi:hypothetical protein